MCPSYSATGEHILEIGEHVLEIGEHILEISQLCPTAAAGNGASRAITAHGGIDRATR